MLSNITTDSSPHLESPKPPVLSCGIFGKRHSEQREQGSAIGQLAL